MFNDLPHTRISGENHNTFGYDYAIEHNLNTHTPQLLNHPMDKPTGPFRHNTIPHGSLGCISQQLHYTMNPPPLSIQQNVEIVKDDLRTTYDRYTILGFKTVRLHLFEQVHSAVEYYKTHFPCTKFIINVQQNITHQLDSYMKNFAGTSKKKKNGDNHDDSEEEEREEEDDDDDDDDDIASHYHGPNRTDLKFIRDFHINVGKELGEEYAKIINFDEWIKDVSVLNDVIDWLGYKDCAFNAIVHDNENGYAVDKTTMIDLGDNCHYPFIEE